MVEQQNELFSIGVLKRSQCRYQGTHLLGYRDSVFTKTAGLGQSIATCALPNQTLSKYHPKSKL
ncbi:uncharacterized protein PHALS_13313 [Plasmopara halstedii]|uniref:Uncharacterized protein n=1 Tax=Plasmopara halstedii TaxID=4781 RepID=A0A0P1AP72_PLAHL|nr:uncharacterized protein PHALS_13313 [Plasmopara halstedii]CEG43095.1 hypothetical protein PHALS_13313 [Plasmopara halstedii]|eukprot:XP_024579464.1 hypothetical protein PHALS_13313 [Plasmopara halstedii]